MPEMETLSQHMYRDKTLKPGDRFDCESGHVQFMIATGRAKPVQHLETMPDPAPDVSALASSAEPTDEDEEPVEETKTMEASANDYRTRDMARQQYNRKGNRKGQQ